MLDTDDQALSERYAASSYPTRLVWLLSFLALYTTFIMVIIVWWTLVDVRTERVKLYEQQNKLSAVKTTLDNTLEKLKWDITAILEGEDTPQDISNEQLFTLINGFKQTADNPRFKDDFSELNKKINSLLQLRNNCRRWLDQYSNTLAKFPPSRKHVESILRRMDESVSRSAGRKKLAWAVKIKEFRQTDPHASGELAHSIINNLAASSDLTSTIRDIHDLTLLYEKLLNEERADHLTYLKDNEIRTVLARLDSKISSTPPKDLFSAVSPLLLDDLITALFGKGYFLDTDHQTIVTGSGEHLYELCVARLNELKKRNSLQNELLQLTGSIHNQVQSIANQTDAYIQGESSSVESAIQRALHIILIVGVATATIFLAISYRIITEIKSQIKAIEDANIVLDNKTQALSKSENALRKSEETLQYLSSNLLTAQERERKRISHELHDELGQSMAALKLQVGAVERRLSNSPVEVIKEECHDIREYINQIIENVRRLSKDLSPVVIDDLGLEAAIEYLTTNFAKLHKVQITIDLPDINPLFAQDAQRLIYRIIQEALNNIGKHAQASQIFIGAEKKNNLVLFTIKDDGQGFDLEEVINKKSTEKGMGLATMAERVRILGGSINFRSKPQQGVKINFTAPMYPGNEDNL